MILHRHMGRDLAAPQIIDECRHVIGLVRAQRAPALAGTVAVDQLKGGFALVNILSVIGLEDYEFRKFFNA